MIVDCCSYQGFLCDHQNTFIESSCTQYVFELQCAIQNSFEWHNGILKGRVIYIYI